MRRSLKLFIVLLLPFLFTVQDSDRILPPPLPAAAPAEAGAPLKILTWNLHFLPTINPFAAISKRARAIAQAIAAEDPTIVVMQESFLGSARKQIQSLLRLRYPYMIGPVNNSHNSLLANSGVWLLSKMPLDSLGGIEFKDCAGADCLARKGALMVQGAWQGRAFQLIATHLQAEQQADIRQRQMQQIETELIAPRWVADVPLFLCGDLNTDIGDASEYDNMLRCLHAVDARPTCALQHSYEDSTNGKMLLDYVLLRHDANLPIVRRILPKAYMPEAQDEELSDHLPLVAEVGL